MSSLVRQMLNPVRLRVPGSHLIVLQQCQAPALVTPALLAPALCAPRTPGFSLLGLVSVVELHTTQAVERARQSTRTRKRKVDLENKKKKEERLRKKPPPIPYKVQLMLKAKGFGDKPLEWRAVDQKPFPVDDVWDERVCSWNRLSVSQALDCLREHYHPTMLDDPKGIVWARVEFNMATNKKDRYAESFSKMVPLYHPFECGVTEKSIMVFAKNEEALKVARAAGAERAGGSDLIDDIAKGKVEVIDYDYFLAHDDIALELRPLLGILREKFPKKLSGTVGSNIEKMVKTFSNGQMVEVKKPKKTLGYNEDPSFGYCEAMIGRLGMSDEDINVNFTLLLENLKESGAKKGDGFITRVNFYIDDRLKYNLVVKHNLIDDKRYKDHVQSARA